jgi:hypothetical protein
MPREQPLYRIAQVAKQMPAICHLNRLGRASAGTLREVARSVATNDANRRMSFQPGSEGLSFGIWQHVDGLVAFQIHDQGAIGAPFAQRPIIHSNDLWFWRWWECVLALQAQQGRGTDGHADLMAQVRARLGAKPKDQLTELCNEPFGAPRKGANGCPKALDKDFPYTRRIGAKEPPHMHAYLNHMPGPGKIGYRTLIPAMNAGRSTSTDGTGRRRLGCSHGQANRLVIRRDRIETKTRHIRQEQ